MRSKPLQRTSAIIAERMDIGQTIVERNSSTTKDKDPVKDQARMEQHSSEGVAEEEQEDEAEEAIQGEEAKEVTEEDSKESEQQLPKTLPTKKRCLIPTNQASQ